MQRGFILLAAGLILLALVVYFTFPGREKGSKSLETDYFCRTVRLISPPHYAVQKGPELKYERWLDRIKWGTNESVNWTIDCLVSETTRPFLAEVERRINLFRTREPSRAKRYIDLMAELHETPAIPTFIKCANDASQMVHHAALKALSRFEDERATDCLIEHAGSPDWNKKSLCLALLAERSDSKVLRFFEDAIINRDPEILSFAMRALADHGGEKFIGLIRPYVHSEDFATRTVAIQSLLKLNDPEANEWLYANLRHRGPVIRTNGVKSLVYAQTVPPEDLMERLARDEDDEIRMLFATVLTQMLENFQGEELKRIENAFHILSKDQRPEIRLKALEGLYGSGRKDVADPYLRRLKKAYGGELEEALSFLARSLHVREAAPLIVERFKSDSKLAAEDRLILLEGLCELAHPEGIGIFFEVILGGWNARKSLNPPLTLDCRAAFMVHHFEGDILSYWFNALEQDDSDYMVYLFLNGARNLEDGRSADRLLELASQTHRPFWLRQEAVRSLALLKDKDLGEKLLIYSAREKNSELSKLAYQVFWNYF